MMEVSLSDDFLDHPLPKNLAELYKHKLLSFRDPPSLHSPPLWPKVIPPSLAPRLVAAAKADDGSAFTADAAAIYSFLSKEEWIKLERDSRADVLASWEWRERAKKGCLLLDEMDAAGERYHSRIRECLAVRFVFLAHSATMPCSSSPAGSAEHSRDASSLTLHPADAAPLQTPSASVAPSPPTADLIFFNDDGRSASFLP